MFSSNCKTLRKAKGLSQEELAVRLRVTRQTISKWENGLSVPDADLLIRLAEVFELSVSELLGEPVEAPEKRDLIAEKLEQLNLQLAQKNARSRRILKTVAAILIGILVLILLCIVLNVVTFQSFRSPDSVSTEMEEMQIEDIEKMV